MNCYSTAEKPSWECSSDCFLSSDNPDCSFLFVLSTISDIFIEVTADLFSLIKLDGLLIDDARRKSKMAPWLFFLFSSFVY